MHFILHFKSAHIIFFHACAGGLLSKQHFLRTVFLLESPYEAKTFDASIIQARTLLNQIWRDLLSIHMKMRFKALYGKKTPLIWTVFKGISDGSMMTHTCSEYPFGHAHYVTISCTWNGLDLDHVGYQSHHQWTFWHVAQALKPNLGPF